MAHETGKSSPGSSNILEIPVVMGMLGMSLQDITKGTKGFVKLPLGPRDLTMAGGRKWVKIKITAMEDVRAFRDIIVGNDQGEIKEHTPVELSYEMHLGGYQRVGEDNPLPVTAVSRSITTITVIVTTAGQTTIVTPATGYAIKVHAYAFSNMHTAVADIGLQFDSGTVTHRRALAANGGNASFNLMDSAFQGAVGQVLSANAAGAYAGGVYVTVAYESVEV